MANAFAAKIDWKEIAFRLVVQCGGSPVVCVDGSDHQRDARSDESRAMRKSL